jgi:hypothetical protein
MRDALAMTDQLPSHEVTPIDINGEVMHFTTFNDIDYEIVDGPAHRTVRVADVMDTLINRIKDAGTRLAGKVSHASDGRPLFGSVTAYALYENPWNNEERVFIDLLEGDWTEAAFSVRSIKALDSDDVRQIVITVLRQHGIELDAIRPQDDGYREVVGPARNWDVITRIPAGIMLGDVAEVHSRLAYTFMYMNLSPTSPIQVVELIRIGGVGRLVGMHENEWLDAKRAPYELKEGKELWKLDLALDVASFANSDQGGVIVVGIATRNIGGSDVLSQIRPVPIEPGRPRRYHDVLNARLAPLVDGLVIESYKHLGGEIVSIFIPPQRAELKPFVVDGGVSRSGHPGRLFSVVRRRGEVTSVASLHEIQALLAAGRAFLRGQEPESQDHS